MGPGEACEEVIELGDTSGIALVALNSVKSGGVVTELYDSGCTNLPIPQDDGPVLTNHYPFLNKAASLL